MRCSSLLPFLLTEFYSFLWVNENGKSRLTRHFSYVNRNEKIYCAGHGCAGIWEVRSDKSPPDFVSAEPLPVYEIPSVTPELSLHKSNKSGKEILSIPIYVFAFENKIDEAFEILQIMLDGYEEWINSLEILLY